MPWYTIVGWVGALVFGAYWGHRARRELSPEGKRRASWVRGAWAPRDAFTDLGWRYQQRAIWGTMAIWIATLLLTAIF